MFWKYAANLKQTSLGGCFCIFLISHLSFVQAFDIFIILTFKYFDLFYKFKAFSNLQYVCKAIKLSKSPKFNIIVEALFCMFGLGQKVTFRSFQIWWVFQEKVIFWAKIGIFWKTWIIANDVRVKEKFSDNLGHNIVEL